MAGIVSGFAGFPCSPHRDALRLDALARKAVRRARKRTAHARAVRRRCGGGHRLIGLNPGLAPQRRVARDVRGIRGGSFHGLRAKSGTQSDFQLVSLPFEVPQRDMLSVRLRCQALDVGLEPAFAVGGRSEFSITLGELCGGLRSGLLGLPARLPRSFALGAGALGIIEGCCEGSVSSRRVDRCYGLRLRGFGGQSIRAAQKLDPDAALALHLRVRHAPLEPC